MEGIDEKGLKKENENDENVEQHLEIRIVRNTKSFRGGRSPLHRFGNIRICFQLKRLVFSIRYNIL